MLRSISSAVFMEETMSSCQSGAADAAKEEMIMDIMKMQYLDMAGSF